MSVRGSSGTVLGWDTVTQQLRAVPRDVLHSAFSALWEGGNRAFSSILHSKTCCQTYRQVASETCLGVFPGPPHCPETHSQIGKIESLRPSPDSCALWMKGTLFGKPLFVASPAVSSSFQVALGAALSTRPWEEVLRDERRRLAPAGSAGRFLCSRCTSSHLGRQGSQAW